MPGNAGMASCLAVDLACDSLSLNTGKEKKSGMLAQDLCDTFFEM